ncbi:MAG: cation transporter [Candidatus Marinimicrobia bacterium]|nr:cation transporter [Candidatus Neomarinimicrobiota bacterium]
MINFLHQKFLSLFIKKSDDPKELRFQYGNFAGWNSIIFNTVLFAMKLVMGFMINSLALIADSVHSISDTATSVIVIIGFKISGKPADKEHPFGHQRAEYVATLVIAIILIVAGIEFIKEGIVRFLNPSELTFPLPILLLVTLTMIVKLWMGHLTKYIGLKIDSKAIQADAVHHYTDVISTVFVLISLFLGNFGLYFFDGIGSALVGLMLIYTGFSIAIETSSTLLGTAPKRELIEIIKNLSNTVNGVIDTHDIIIHQYGDNKFISLHIEINCNLTCGESHTIAKDVEIKLKDELQAHVIVHIDPIELNNPVLEGIKLVLANFKANNASLQDYHDIRMNKEHDLIIFDIVAQSNDTNIAEQITAELEKKFNNFDFEIHVDPIFVNN